MGAACKCLARPVDSAIIDSRSSAVARVISTSANGTARRTEVAHGVHGQHAEAEPEEGVGSRLIVGEEDGQE